MLYFFVIFSSYTLNSYIKLINIKAHKLRCTKCGHTYNNLNLTAYGAEANILHTFGNYYF